jgi:hypothetical protein
MLLLHLSDVDALARPARAGAVGGFGLFTLQAALAPNATVWTFAYVLGPGFSVGAGTTVSPSGVRLGDLPGLPMLGGLPGGRAPWPCYVLFLIAPAAGALGGIVAVRRMGRTPRLPMALLVGAGIAGAMALITLVAATLSGGPVTRGRLATIGPSPWQTALFAALEVGVPAIAAALSLSWYRERARRLEPAAASAATGLPAEPRASLRGRLQLGGKRLRIPGFAIARRASGAVLGVLGGFAAGLGLDRLRRSRAEPDAGPDVAPPVVDLVKAERPRVNLLKGAPPARPAIGDTQDTEALDLSELRVKRRRLRLPRLWRPHVPKRLRRKRKVIKLPD